MGLVSAQSIGLPEVLRNTVAEGLGHLRAAPLRPPDRLPRAYVDSARLGHPDLRAVLCSVLWGL